MGRVFHSFSVEIGGSGLTLADGIDRHMEARDIHTLSPSRGDDCYIVECGSTSRATHRWFTCYRDKWQGLGHGM